jgi:PAS domain-containing protein
VNALARAHPSTRFCSRCGAGSADPVRRICDRCEAGILLGCNEDALPGEAFLIFNHDLEVTAVSEAAEQIFGPEHDLLGMQLLELATCPLGDDQLARHAELAAQRAREPVTLPVRVRSERGESLGTLTARVTTCGPPRGALVTLQRSAFGRR